VIVALTFLRMVQVPVDRVINVIPLWRDLMTTSRTVLVVGDGVNNAEVLVAASLRIGVGGAGADIALESAREVLVSPRLELLPHLVRTGHFCPRGIRQDIAIAPGFKPLFLVLAAQNMAILWLAAAADIGATLVVIFNGLRLLRGP
jgi:Cd2+/Zn2+-exporting ATPase